MVKAGIILFLVLLAIYIPLKIYLVSSGQNMRRPFDQTIDIFFTNQLRGYWTPCG